MRGQQKALIVRVKSKMAMQCGQEHCDEPTMKNRRSGRSLHGDPIEPFVLMSKTFVEEKKEKPGFNEVRLTE